MAVEVTQAQVVINADHPTTLAIGSETTEIVVERDPDQMLIDGEPTDAMAVFESREASLNLVADHTTLVVAEQSSVLIEEGAGQALAPDRIYAQPEAPQVPAGIPFLWLQTGMGADGSGMTLWFETGSA